MCGVAAGQQLKQKVLEQHLLQGRVVLRQQLYLYVWMHQWVLDALV
jgi:hypothetical protein